MSDLEKLAAWWDQNSRAEKNAFITGALAGWVIVGIIVLITQAGPAWDAVSILFSGVICGILEKFLTLPDFGLYWQFWIVGRAISRLLCVAGVGLWLYWWAISFKAQPENKKALKKPRQRAKKLLWLTILIHWFFNGMAIVATFEH